MSAELPQAPAYLARRVLWPGFLGRTAPAWLLDELKLGLGGAVLFAGNLDPDDPAQHRRLTDELHAASPHAIVGVDEEGGTVTRLDAAHGSAEPGNGALGRVDDVAATARSAARLGVRCAAAGIDLDLAPDADVNVDPRNPVIGTRSFGSDPELVARHVAAAVRGLQSAGVAACAKHFPGHGDTVTDSHLDLAVSDVSLEELRRVHLPPFRAAIDAGVRAVMTAHLRVPVLGAAPATLNERAIRMLRDLGFDGVVVTDAVDMAAIRESVGSGPGAVAALRAGADLVCIGNPADRGEGADEREYEEVRDAVLAALASGELPVERLEQAATRLDALVAWRTSALQRVGEAADRPSRKPTPEVTDALDVATRALDPRGEVTLAPGPVLLIDARRGAATMAEGPGVDRFAAALGRHREVLEPTADPAREAAAHPGEVVLVTGTPQSNPPEAALRDAVLAARPDAVLVIAGWPDPDAPEPARSIRAWGSAPPNAEAVARLLAP